MTIQQGPRQREPSQGIEKESPIGDPAGSTGVILTFVALSCACAKAMIVMSARTHRTAHLAFMGLAVGTTHLIGGSVNILERNIDS